MRNIQSKNALIDLWQTYGQLDFVGIKSQDRSGGHGVDMAKSEYGTLYIVVESIVVQDDIN